MGTRRAVTRSTPSTRITANPKSERSTLTTTVGARMLGTENPDLTHQRKFRRIAVKEKTPVVKQLYRLSVEPRVVEQLARLAERLREPRSRLASRIFTEAVMGAKLPRR